jgi:hypothetical protein
MCPWPLCPLVFPLNSVLCAPAAGLPRLHARLPALPAALPACPQAKYEAKSFTLVPSGGPQALDSASAEAEEKASRWCCQPGCALM